MADIKADTDSSSLSSCARSEAQRIREHEIREREQAAFAGPWVACRDEDDIPLVCQAPNHDGPAAWPDVHIIALTPSTAEFIAHARQDIPWLLQRSEEARETIEKQDYKIGDLLQSLNARESETRQAREAMQSLDVFYVEKLKHAEEALAAARQEKDVAREALTAIFTAVRGDEKSECWTIRKWLEEHDVFHDDLGSVERLIEAVCAFALGGTADLAAARLRATPQEQDDSTRSGRVAVEPPPQPAAADKASS